MSTDDVGPQPTEDDVQTTDTALYPTGDPEPDEQRRARGDIVEEPDEAAVDAARVRMDEVKTEAVANHYRV